jgi:uracil-DNA glycosylase
MAAAVRCAPPQNKPSVTERDTCAPWLTTELAFVAPSLRAIVCLGHFAWQAIWPQLAALGWRVPRPRPPFGHGVEVQVSDANEIGRGNGGTGPGRNGGTGPGRNGPGDIGAEGDNGAAGNGSGGILVIGCYHPSQQNTFTGRVTGVMLDAVFQRARRYAGL